MKNADPVIDEMISEVDERTAGLVREMKEYTREFTRLRPDEAAFAFQDWLIQKISGLQVVVEKQAEAIRLLIDAAERRGGL